MNNIYVVKTVPESGDGKYFDQHVWDIFWQVKRHFNHDYTFNLLTNFTTIMHPDINVIDVTKYGYDGWWNKMLLFNPQIDKEGTNLYFDLDVTIENNISNLPDFIFDNLLTCVYCYWKPINWLDISKQSEEVQRDPDMKFPSFYNTSVMGWTGGTFHDLWKDFEKDDQYIMTKYRGNEDYLGNEWLPHLKALPRNTCYSHFYGANVGSEFFPRDKDAYMKRNDYFIRLLNGPGKD